MFKNLVICIVLPLLLILSGQRVYGAEIPGADRSISLTAREQSLAEFVDILFREINVPLANFDSLAGVVNGRFAGTVGSVLDEVAVAFGIVFYYDGAVAHVFPSNQLANRLMPLSSTLANRTVGFVKRTGMSDKNNYLVKEDGGLLVKGVPRFVQQVSEVVDLLKKSPLSRKIKKKPMEIPPEEMTYRVFQLKHAWADDTSYSINNQNVVVPGVASVIRALVTNNELPSEIVFAGELDRLSKLESVRGDSKKFPNQVSTAAGNRAGTNSNKGSTVNIVSDTRSNSIIISDRLSRMWVYEVLIEQLDKPAEMVEIEAKIIDIDSEKSRDLGVSWGVTSEDRRSSFGVGSDENTVANGAVLSLAQGDRAEFLTRVSALEKRGAARVVSTPHIVTLSNVEGVLGSTNEFFVRIATDQEVDLFKVPVGTTLRVKPHVFVSGNTKRIKLFVSIEDGAKAAGNNEVDGIPFVERSNINTQAIVDVGDSLLVGGLARESSLRGENRVPFLGSIPFIGSLFRSTSKATERVERLFMITPRIAEQGKFKRHTHIPRLEGVPSSFLTDTRRSFEVLRWPAKEFEESWVKELRGLSRERQPVLAVARFVSPFKVENWDIQNDGEIFFDLF